MNCFAKVQEFVYLLTKMEKLSQKYLISKLILNVLHIGEVTAELLENKKLKYVLSFSIGNVEIVWNKSPKKIPLKPLGENLKNYLNYIKKFRNSVLLTA